MRWFRGTLVAALAIVCIFHSSSALAQGKTRVLCLSAYDDEFFYFAATVQKPNLVGRSTKIFSDPISDDAVAVFLQSEENPIGPKRDGKSVELAVSAAGGAQLYRGADATPLKDFNDLPKGANNIPVPFKFRSSVTGRLNAPGDAKTGYVVELAIPWIELGGPPKTGQKMRMNVVAYSAAEGSPRTLSLSPTVKGAGDIQNPSFWQEIVFVDAPVKSYPEAPNAKVCARVFANKPFIDGTITEGEWNTLTAFGFSEAEGGGGTATFNPAAATARVRPPIALKAAPTPLPLPINQPGVVPARVAQTVPHLVFSLYHYDVQGDPRKSAPLLSVRQPNGISLLATHPVSGTGPWMSYDRVDWHRGQLQEMREAGIDVALPVYRASAGSKKLYSTRGLSNLTAALKTIDRAGRDFPVVAMFLDTSSLNDTGAKVDLKQAEGQALLYAAIKDFYLQIPPSYRLGIALDPKSGGSQANLVVLSSAAPFSDFGQSFMDYCRGRFMADFGNDLIFLGSSDFKTKCKLDGYVNDTAGKGFSMDDSGWLKPAAIGIAKPAADGKTAVVPMAEAAETYKNSWKQVQAKRPDWVLIDGWNEFGNGSEIAPTLERGVNLSDITKVYSRVLAATDAVRVAFINNNVPQKVLAGSNCAITVRLQNIGMEIWAPENYAVSYGWRTTGGEAGKNGAIALPAEITPGSSRTLVLNIPIPAKPGTYLLAIDVGRVDRAPTAAQSSRFLSTGGLPLTCGVRVASAGEAGFDQYAASLTSSELPRTAEAGGTYTVPVKVRNDGSAAWKQGGTRVTCRLWKRVSALNGSGDPEAVEPVEMADGSATVPSDVAPGQEVSVSVPVTFSRADGGTISPSPQPEMWGYEVRWEVTDGTGKGAYTEPEAVSLTEADIGVVFTHDLTPDQLPGDRRIPVKLGVRNAGPQTWRKDVTRIGYHWYYLDGMEAVWEDETTAIPQDVEPGGEVPDILAWITPPPNDGNYWLVWDLKVGNTWTSTLPSVRSHETQVNRVQIVHGHLTFVDLSTSYNLAGITLDAARGSGAFDGAGRSLPAELTPPFAMADFAPSTLWIPTKGTGLASSRNISFKWGPKGVKENNVVQCAGQKVTVEADSKKAQICKTVHILAAATSPGATGGFTLQFADGSQQFSSFPVAAWDDPTSTIGEVAFVTRRTHVAGGEAFDKAAFIYHYTIAVKEEKKLTTIILPNAPAIKILAITLEKP